MLGSMEELLECVRMADILKPAKAAAQDVLQHMQPSAPEYGGGEGGRECE